MIRFVLLLVALLAIGWLIAFHGVRAIALLAAIAIIVTVPKTRAWKAIERVLVRITGSRRRAAVLAALVVIGVALAVNIVPLVR